MGKSTTFHIALLLSCFVTCHAFHAANMPRHTFVKNIATKGRYIFDAASTKPKTRITSLSLQMKEGKKKDDKWAANVESEDQERIESGKVAVASAISGSIAFAPFALFVPAEFYAGGAPFSAQWEFQHDSLALILALFGLVYRYAVRQDPNPQLKQGVVGAFVITRALAMLNVDPSCTAMPLQCGAPIGYLNWSMIYQLGGAAFESILAFGASAAFIELCFAKGWLKQFPSS